MSSRNPLQPQVSHKPEITFLIHPNAPYRPDRLRVSSCIQLATTETTGQEYQADAYIPRLPFQSCDRGDLLETCPNRTPVRSRTIGLIKISDGLLESLRTAAAGFHDASDLRFYIDDVCR